MKGRVKVAAIFDGGELKWKSGPRWKGLGGDRRVGRREREAADNTEGPSLTGGALGAGSRDLQDPVQREWEGFSRDRHHSVEGPSFLVAAQRRSWDVALGSMSRIS